MTSRIVLLLAAFLAFAVPCAAQTLTVRTLPGGATLIVSQEPDAETVVIEAFFRVGVADENAAGESGLTALLARTWAGGGGTNRLPRQIARDIGRFGSFGVHQSPDYLELWTISGYAESEIAAQTLLQNVVAAPLFLPASVESAKREMARDRIVRGDSLGEAAETVLRARVFALSPDGRDPLGDAQNTHSLTNVALRRFYDRTVGKDARRAVFVVAGRMGADEAERLVKSCLAAGDWAALRENGDAEAKAKPAVADTVPANLKPFDTRRPSPTRLSVTGYIAPGTTEGADLYAMLCVLDAVMGGGKDCRLFALRDRVLESEPAIGYDISSRIHWGREQSLWTVTVSGVNGSAKTATDRVIAACRAAGLGGSSPVTADELVRAKAWLIGKHRQNRQRLADRASALGAAQVMGIGASFEADYEARIGAVTLDDVQSLSGRVFGANAATVTTGSE